MEKNFSIDLETMGLEPGHAVLSIGIAEFDEGGVQRTDQINVSLASCMEAGLGVDADTLVWWLGQPKEAQDKLFLPEPVSLNVALTQLNGFMSRGDGDIIVWGNGATFDLGILAAAYRAANRTPPWHFRHERDIRTAKALGKKMGMKYPDRPEVGHHQAVIDATYQARIVVDTMVRVKQFWG